MIERLRGNSATL
jgi:hypothetical protein